MDYGIERGHTGLAVYKMQQYLNLLRNSFSAIPLLEEDGDFGPETENAVRLFQEAVGLPADGIIGTLTWDKIIEKIMTMNTDPAEPDTTPLMIGAQGLDVQKMQGYLNALMPDNIALETDGLFGPKTESLVIQFQIQQGLKANGKIDGLTWNRIISLL